MTNFKEEIIQFLYAFVADLDSAADSDNTGLVHKTWQRGQDKAIELYNQVLDEIVEEAELQSNFISVVQKDSSIIGDRFVSLNDLKQIIQSKKGE